MKRGAGIEASSGYRSMDGMRRICLELHDNAFKINAPLSMTTSTTDAGMTAKTVKITVERQTKRRMGTTI